MHLHVREAAEKLEEAQADITRRVVVIARKETVKYISRRPLGNSARTNVFGSVCAPQPRLGSPHLLGIFLPVRACVPGWGGSPTRAAGGWMGWRAPVPAAGGCAAGGRRGRAEAPRGAARFPGWGRRDPRPRLRENHINGKTKAGPAGGGPAGAGERNTVQEGKEKSFAGEELSS